MRKTLHPKFRIFKLEGLRDVGIKTFKAKVEDTNKN